MINGYGISVLLLRCLVRRLIKNETVPDTVVVPGTVLTIVMEPKIEFVPSAFRHGFTEEDIRWVLNNYLIDGVVEEGGVIMPRLTDEEYAALDENGDTPSHYQLDSSYYIFCATGVVYLFT
jgi:hypothetical protein